MHTLQRGRRCHRCTVCMHAAVSGDRLVWAHVALGLLLLPE